MPPGKLASQACHAASQSLLEFIAENPKYLNSFRELGRSGSRIILKCKNDFILRDCYEKAKNIGLPCALFEDNGHVLLPHFDGINPVLTAAAIGPCYKSECQFITKKLRLVQ